MIMNIMTLIIHHIHRDHRHPSWSSLSKSPAAVIVGLIELIQNFTLAFQLFKNHSSHHINLISSFINSHLECLFWISVFYQFYQGKFFQRNLQQQCRYFKLIVKRCLQYFTSLQASRSWILICCLKKEQIVIPELEQLCPSSDLQTRR